MESDEDTLFCIYACMWSASNVYLENTSSPLQFVWGIAHLLLLRLFELIVPLSTHLASIISWAAFLLDG